MNKFISDKIAKLTAGLKKLKNDKNNSHLCDSVDNQKFGLIGRVFGGLPKNIIADILLYSVEPMKEHVIIKDVLVKTDHAVIYNATVNNYSVVAKTPMYYNTQVCDTLGMVLEASNMARVSLHFPNLNENITYLGIYIGSSQPYIVMSYAETDLYNAMKLSAALVYESFRYIARDIIVGLAIVHDEDLIHRDIHAGNIFLTKLNDKYRASIGDFGHSISRSPRMTHEIGISGTRAPELIRHKQFQVQYTNKVDMWAVGCLLFYIVFGKKMPDNEQGIIGMRMSLSRSNIADDLKELLCGLLTIDPRSRWSATRALQCKYIQSFL